MPYFIYKITPGPTELAKNLERLTEFDKFIDAKNHARALRAELGTDTDLTIKVMFAATALEAEEKLLEYREPQIVREWEK
ncbi:MAG: hypothetical protein K8I04_07075 [Gammaproteobacteria bacterium]|nr:hypothetical protein [Gammaproteobacteria bacterium]